MFIHNQTYGVGSTYLLQGGVSEARHGKVQLIVVDSVSALVTPVLGAGGTQHSQGHALMLGVGRLLKHIAVHYTLAVLCTNHVVGSNSEPRPALGETWKNQPHVRLHLTRSDMNASIQSVAAACCSAALNDWKVQFTIQ